MSLLTLLLASCGDPLVNGDYPGNLIVSYFGEMVRSDTQQGPGGSGDGPRDEPAETTWGQDANIQTTIFWASQGGSARLPVVSDVIFPWSHRTSLFNPPDAFVQPLNGSEQAIGVVLMYGDTNGDGLWSPGEAVWGNGTSSFIRYLPNGTGRAAADDFSLIEWSCEGSTPVIRERNSQTESHLVLGYEARGLPDLDCDGDAFETTEWDGFCTEGCVLYEE